MDPGIHRRGETGGLGSLLVAHHKFVICRSNSLICMEPLATVQILWCKPTDDGVRRWGLGVVTGSLGKHSYKGDRDHNRTHLLGRVKRCPL